MTRKDDSFNHILQDQFFEAKVFFISFVKSTIHVPFTRKVYRHDMGQGAGFRPTVSIFFEKDAL